MESNDYNGGFEHFLKEKADQYKLYPSDRVWSAINDKLHPRNKWPYVMVAAIFIGLGIGGNIFDSSIAAGPSKKTGKNLTATKPVLASVSLDKLELDPISPKNSPLAVSGIPTGTAAKTPGPLRVAYVAPGVSRQNENRRSGGIEPAPPVAELASIEQPITDSEERISADPIVPSTSQLEADMLMVNDKVRVPATITSIKKSSSGRKLVADSRKTAPKTTAIRVLKPYKNMFGLQFYVTPTVSYRRLSGHGIRTYNSTSGNYNYSGDVNAIVDHRPMIGTEAGMSLVFSMNKKLRFKTGLQFNFTQYEAQAYRYTAELVPMTAAGIGHSQINAVSTFRSTSGLSNASLRNQRMMVSIPIGAELSVINRKNVQFNVAGSIQPTYVINNQSYMISSDLKNYAQAPALYRHFNMNGAVEAFISFRTGATKWNAGPQLRYQLLSSYKSAYPISEHLIDYGFKIGMTRTLK